MNNIAIIGDTGLIGSSLKKLIKTKHNYNSNNIDLFDPNMTKSITGEIDKIIFLQGQLKGKSLNDYNTNSINTNIILDK